MGSPAREENPIVFSSLMRTAYSLLEMSRLDAQPIFN